MNRSAPLGILIWEASFQQAAGPVKRLPGFLTTPFCGASRRQCRSISRTNQAMRRVIFTGLGEHGATGSAQNPCEKDERRRVCLLTTRQPE